MHKRPAIMNHGRWLIFCPRCSTALPAQESGIVCPRCYPEIMARAFRQLPNGLLRPVPDVDLIEKARDQARRNNEIYVPEYPDEKAKIEKILRLRPDRKHMNWVPGETLADLRQQNIDHGDPIDEE